MREPVYEVFARKTRDEALRHVGYINAGDPELARVYAWQTYDEQNWFEMCVVARVDLLPVNRPAPHAAASVPAATGDVAHAIGAASYGGDDVVGAGEATS
ncbi:MAG: hypothetical protein M3409_07930 [Gemmatimonadota bacterium]|nr:hypothetical protein [Gemmatimonadota bacterium]